MTKIKLSGGEIDSFADAISRILEDVPLFFLSEVMEIAHENRIRYGEDPDLDVSSEEESSDEEECEIISDEEEESESDDDDDSDG
tara:strand:- start:12031 stop:12285 length:255 start_codon:yes stop_codon:yes gene_type:complete